MEQLNFPNYNNQHKKQVIALLGDASFKKKLWDWQFTDPNRPTWQPIVAEGSAGSVLGFNAVMPAKVYYDGELIEAAWSCDFIVASSCRGKGLGQKIKDKLHKQYPLLFSLGISDQAIRVLDKMGWKKGTPVTAYSKRNTINNFKDIIISAIQKLNQVKTLFIKKNKNGPNINFRLSSQLPEKDLVNQLSANSLKGYERIVIRDFDYLNWRYMQHPLSDYDYISLWSNEQLLGLGVIRTNKKQSILVDYLGPKQNIALKLQLIRAWHLYCPKIPAMSCTTSDLEIGIALKTFGFRAAQQQRFYVYGEPNDCAHHWFIMSGDSDGDILQAAISHMDT